MSPLELVGTVSLLWLGTLYTYTATLKLVAPVPGGLADPTGVLPGRLWALVSRALPFIELGIAILLVVPMEARVGSALSLGFALAVLVVSIHSRSVSAPCGCAGAYSSQSLGRKTVARAGLMALASAASLAVQPPAWLILAVLATACVVVVLEFRGRLMLTGAL